MSLHATPYWTIDRAPVVALALACGAYAVGLHRLRSRARITRGMRREALCFAAAALTVGLAIASPLDALSHGLFIAHMTQHLLLAVVAPPLLVLAAPERVLARSLPKTLIRRVARAPRARRLWRFATLPLAAWTLHTVAIWVWHTPAMFAAALANDGVHAAEHVSFLATGVLVWVSVLRRGRRGYALGMLTLFAVAIQSGTLGALFGLSQRVLYAGQSHEALRWGLTPLEDQQLAGFIMWIPGGLLYVVALSCLFVAWLEPSAKRRVARVIAVGAAAATGGMTACRRERPSVIAGGDVERGRQTIETMGCGACHAISGVPGAAGQVGPPLNGVASRAIIGGVLPNTPANMVAWIEDPPSLAPHTAMPNLGVAPAAARDIVAYLYTLR
jgi:putative membrane protein